MKNRLSKPFTRHKIEGEKIFLTTDRMIDNPNPAWQEATASDFRYADYLFRLGQKFSKIPDVYAFEKLAFPSVYSWEDVGLKTPTEIGNNPCYNQIWEELTKRLVEKETLKHGRTLKPGEIKKILDSVEPLTRDLPDQKRSVWTIRYAKKLSESLTDRKYKIKPNQVDNKSSAITSLMSIEFQEPFKQQRGSPSPQQHTHAQPPRAPSSQQRNHTQRPRAFWPQKRNHAQQPQGPSPQQRNHAQAPQAHSPWQHNPHSPWQHNHAQPPQAALPQQHKPHPPQQRNRAQPPQDPSPQQHKPHPPQQRSHTQPPRAPSSQQRNRAQPLMAPSPSVSDSIDFSTVDLSEMGDVAELLAVNTNSPASEAVGIAPGLVLSDTSDQIEQVGSAVDRTIVEKSTKTPWLSPVRGFKEQSSNCRKIEEQPTDEQRLELDSSDRSAASLKQQLEEEAMAAEQITREMVMEQEEPQVCNPILIYDPRTDVELMGTVAGGMVETQIDSVAFFLARLSNEDLSFGNCSNSNPQVGTSVSNSAEIEWQINYELDNELETNHALV